jgi:hypothetical protein
MTKTLGERREKGGRSIFYFQVCDGLPVFERLEVEIFGIDDLPSDDLSPPPDLLNYIKSESLNQLCSLVLFGDGTATSMAYNIFMHDPAEEPLLPQLSHFVLAINDVARNDDLCRYLRLIVRQRNNRKLLQTREAPSSAEAFGQLGIYSTNYQFESHQYFVGKK